MERNMFKLLLQNEDACLMEVVLMSFLNFLESYREMSDLLYCSKTYEVSICEDSRMNLRDFENGPRGEKYTKFLELRENPFIGLTTSRTNMAKAADEASIRDYQDKERFIATYTLFYNENELYVSWKTSYNIGETGAWVKQADGKWDKKW
jgi:hypothetical protein